MAAASITEHTEAVVVTERGRDHQMQLVRARALVSGFAVLPKAQSADPAPGMSTWRFLARLAQQRRRDA